MSKPSFLPPPKVKPAPPASSYSSSSSSSSSSSEGIEMPSPASIAVASRYDGSGWVVPMPENGSSENSDAGDAEYLKFLEGLSVQQETRKRDLRLMREAVAMLLEMNGHSSHPSALVWLRRIDEELSK